MRGIYDNFLQLEFLTSLSKLVMHKCTATPRKSLFFGIENHHHHRLFLLMYNLTSHKKKSLIKLVKQEDFQVCNLLCLDFWWFSSFHYHLEGELNFFEIYFFFSICVAELAKRSKSSRGTALCACVVHATLKIYLFFFITALLLQTEPKLGFFPLSAFHHTMPLPVSTPKMHLAQESIILLSLKKDFHLFFLYERLKTFF